jgi:hypothetical protein
VNKIYTKIDLPINANELCLWKQHQIYPDIERAILRSFFDHTLDKTDKTYIGKMAAQPISNFRAPVVEVERQHLVDHYKIEVLNAR